VNKGIILITPLGAKGKKSALYEHIISMCPDNDYSSVLYLTPAVFSLKESNRQFFSFIKKRTKKKVYIPFQSFTLKNFCSHLYKIHGDRTIVSDRIEPLILCEIMGGKNIGHAHLLSNLLSKMRNYRLNKTLTQTREEIQREIFEERTKKQADRAIDILGIYEKELVKKGMIDFESAVKSSIHLIEKHINPGVLVLDGFFDPSLLELEIMKTLIKKAEKTLILVEENAESRIFFESLDAEFTKKKLKSSQKRKRSGYHPYPSMEDETEAIAKKVKGLILEGESPDEIIVSFPIIAKYLPMLRRIFQKHGIPINVSEFDISHTRPVVALEDMLVSIENDYPRNEFLSFLTSAHFPRISRVLKEWAVVFSNRAGIVKGKKAWLSISETLLVSAEEEMSSEMTETIDKFQAELKKLVKTLETLKDTDSPSSFIDKVALLLNTLGFFDSLDTLPIGLFKDEIISTMDRLFAEMRQFALLCSSGKEGSAMAGFYLKQLLKGLSGSEEHICGVRIIPFEFAAGLECKALFFGGMIENDLPSKPSVDPLLPERVKKTLGLPFLEYYIDRQRRYFERILHSSSDEPIFSYPTADGDKIFLPSPFLDWDMSLSSSMPNILTEEEILIKTGALQQRDFSCSLWDGKLANDTEIQKIFLKRFGSKTFFRVTDIDAYRKCPLRFYIERFLCLEREKTPQFEVEAKIWGKLVHKTMEYLLKQGKFELEDLEKRIFNALELSLKEFPIADFWSNVAREIFRKLVPLIKDQEREMRRKGLMPYLCEEPLKASFHDLKLKGKIDRVDIKKSCISHAKYQKDNSQDKVVLLDYKTGSIDRENLQLPLYVSLWQEKHVEPVEKTGFYSLKEGYVDWYPKKINVEEFAQNALKRARELVHAMRDAIFEPIPFREGECRYCSHENICRKNN
jgi:RecB family exonuclease/DNA replication initiation complex subunit (GINS family)